MLEDELDLDTLLELTPRSAGSFCERELDAERLEEELDDDDGLFISRKEFCEFLSIGESTLTGWLKNDRIPRAAKHAYVLLCALRVMQREVRELRQGKRDLKIVKYGEHYQICKFSEDADGDVMGNVVADNIPNISTARQLAASWRTSRLLQEAHTLINEEIESRDGFISTRRHEDVRDRIARELVYVWDNNKSRDRFSKRALEDFDIDVLTINETHADNTGKNGE